MRASPVSGADFPATAGTYAFIRSDRRRASDANTFDCAANDVFCNSLKINIRALEAQGAAVCYRRFSEWAVSNRPSLAFRRLLSTKESRPRFETLQDDNVKRVVTSFDRTSSEAAGDQLGGQAFREWCRSTSFPTRFSWDDRFRRRRQRPPGTGVAPAYTRRARR